MKRLCFYLLLLPVVLAGCINGLDDPRDLCCSNAIVHYRYVRYANDEYREFVHGMRHFLFRQDGVYIGEVPSNPANPQDLELKGLAQGRYTIVTVGNAGTDSKGENTVLSPLESGKSKLADFQLALYGTDQLRRNSEELFWNTISVDLTDRKTEKYTADLANIHCHLQYRVVWQDAPDLDGTYRMEMTGASDGYSLDPAQASPEITVNAQHSIKHLFPKHSDRLTGYESKTDLFQHRLEGEIVSLRYRDDRIPTIRLFHGDQAITKPIDLGRVFAEWGWRPDKRAEQIYRIEIRINRDGSITIRPWNEVTIADWQPGGTVVK